MRGRSTLALGDLVDNESDFDFRALTRAQLEHAVENIDGTKDPRNLADARAALEARIAGLSPEPVRVVDAAAELRFTHLLEKIIALLLIGCAVAGVSIDDLWIPMWSHYRGLRIYHLHGISAWIGALAIVVLAAIPFFGGVDDTNGLRVARRFRAVFWLGIIILLLAFGISWYDEFV